MELKDILYQIPDYKDFMTISELDESSRELAEIYESVELKTIGKSREGRDIYCLKIGEGKQNALLFAFPHPNEPIGSMTLEFLSRFLANNPKFTKETGYTWYIIKAIDIDGAVLNEGWFKGKFNPIKYAKNYFRPASFDQIEWSFPIKYKKLNFKTPPPETEALMKLMKDIKPKFMYSLHNSAFGGAYFYISHGIGNIFSDLIDFVKREEISLHLGEPELSYIKKLHDAIFQHFGVEIMYDYIESKGVENPQEFILNGGSSFDYLQQVTNQDNFTIVCELPYFFHESIGGNTLTEFDRRTLYLKSLEYRKKIYKYSRKTFNHIRKFCDPKSRIYVAIEDYMRRTRPEIELSLNDVKNSSDFDGKASIAQAFDLNVSKKYYCLLIVSMIVRLCREAMLLHPESNAEIKQVKIEFEKWIEEQINDLLKGVPITIIPIQKLVRIQIGSAFIALNNLSKIF